MLMSDDLDIPNEFCQNFAPHDSGTYPCSTPEFQSNMYGNCITSSVQCEANYDLNSFIPSTMCVPLIQPTTATYQPTMPTAVSTQDEVPKNSQLFQHHLVTSSHQFQPNVTAIQSPNHAQSQANEHQFQTHSDQQQVTPFQAVTNTQSCVQAAPLSRYSPPVMTSAGYQPEKENDNSKKVNNVEDRLMIRRKPPRQLIFDGSDEENDWASFYVTFDIFAKYCGWTTEEEKVAQLCGAMKGKAQKYFTSMLRREKSITFEQLVQRMEKRFDLKELIQEYQRQFESARQTENEELYEWLDRLWTLSDKAFRDLPFEYVMNKIIMKLCQGCYDKEAGSVALSFQPKTLDEALEKIKWVQHCNKVIFSEETVNSMELSKDASGSRDVMYEENVSDNEIEHPIEHDEIWSRLEHIENILMEMQAKDTEMTRFEVVDETGGEENGKVCESDSPFRRYKNECKIEDQCKNVLIGEDRYKDISQGLQNEKLIQAERSSISESETKQFNTPHTRYDHQSTPFIRYEHQPKKTMRKHEIGEIEPVQINVIEEAKTKNTCNKYGSSEMETACYGPYRGLSRPAHTGLCYSVQEMGENSLDIMINEDSTLCKALEKSDEVLSDMKTLKVEKKNEIEYLKDDAIIEAGPKSQVLSDMSKPEIVLSNSDTGLQDNAFPVKSDCTDEKQMGIVGQNNTNIAESNTVTAGRLKDAQNRDSDLNLIHGWCTTGVRPPEYLVRKASNTAREYLMHKDGFFVDDNGILWDRSRSGKCRLVIPKQLTTAVIMRSHLDGSRCRSICETRENVKSLYYWYKMNKEVKEYVQSCLTCKGIGKAACEIEAGCNVYV